MTHLLPAVCAMRPVQASPSTLRAWAAGTWSCSSRWSRCALLRLLCALRAAGPLRWPANGPKQPVHRGCCEWNALISVKWRQMSRCAAPAFYYMLPPLTTCPLSPAPSGHRFGAGQGHVCRRALLLTPAAAAAHGRPCLCHRAPAGQALCAGSDAQARRATARVRQPRGRAAHAAPAAHGPAAAGGAADERLGCGSSGRQRRWHPGPGCK